MVRRLAVLAVLASLQGLSQNPLSSSTFGGSADDSIHSVAVDSSGNIYVVGTTFSFDLPLLNAYQSANSGTQLVSSSNSGGTWSPVSNPFPNITPLQNPTIAADPANPSKIYVGSASNICSSTDGGNDFRCVSLPGTTFQTNISSIAVDPRQTSTIYASASVNGGVFKSVDGGQTWTNISFGLPSSGFIDSLTLDPFHENVIYAWAGAGGYVSQDSGASWQLSSLPWPSGVSVGSASIHFTFDPVVSGIMYGPGYVGNALTTQKSVDGGQTWTQLSTPFTNACCVVADSKTSGVLYIYAGGQPYANPPVTAAVWKSVDGGTTWASNPIPASASGPLTIDPNNPQFLLASPYRSADAGATWQPMNVSRALQPAFSPSASGQVYALAPITSDAFLAKFQPDGKTLVFATYFGGMGGDAGSSIALDPSGNIWIAGTTSSFDLPVTTGSFQTSLSGIENGFIAKFTSDGRLSAASYIGGSNQDQALGLAVDPQGNPWIIGAWTSPNFPFSTSPPSNLNSLSNGFLAEFDPTVSRLTNAVPIDGQFDLNGKGIAIDPSGNVTLTGSTYDPNFPVTSGAFQRGTPANYNPKTFVMKSDPSGKLVYSTFFGGSHLPLTETDADEQDLGIAVAVDAAGEAYITGYTTASDFPVTSAAYQSSIDAKCPYPAYSDDTGTIGTIAEYLMGDSFVVKLDPQGKSQLYSTYIGGSCYDHPTSIAVDTSGNAYIAGETDSIDYPLSSPVQGAPLTQQFASFVSVLNPAGSSLPFSTYLYAGSDPSLATAANGSIIVSGSSGLGAQSANSSSFVNPFPATATDGYLASIQLPSGSAPFTLTEVANAFSLLGGPVAPGEIVMLSLPGFNPPQDLNAGIYVNAPLAASFGGVQVTFDGIPAYLITVSPGQIVCIAPVEIATRQTTPVQVSANGAASNVLTLNVAATALGLLSADGSGTGLANARNSDGTLNSAQNPAQPGTNVTLFLTGAGVTIPAEADGIVPTSTNISPAAAINGSTSVQALPGFIPGIFAYTLAIPTGQQKQQLGVILSSSSSQSQNLFIYVN